MPTSVAIRLGVEGGAEVKRVLAETGQDGQAAFQKIAAASDAAGAAVDRQTAKFQRMAAAAREAETQARAQANINAVLGVGQGSAGAARDSATVFELQARAAEEAARRAEVLSREVATLQSRFDPMAAAGARYSATLADIARAEDIGAISAARASAARLAAVRSFEDQTQRLERAGLAQKASAQAMVNGQMIVPNRGADVVAYGDELDRLRAKYSPLFAAQREYLGQLAEIRQAVRTGALTQAEGAAAIQSTKDAFARQVTDLRARGDGRLTANQAQGLFYQGTDIVASAASGMSPMTILLQQGGQIAPIFAGPGSASIKGAVGQATEAVTGFVSRIGLVGGALIAGGTIVATATMAWRGYAASVREVDLALAGRGRASGATTAQINEIAGANAGAAQISEREARSMAASFASTGRIGTEMYGGLIRVAKDYAATVGGDLSDAQAELASAFAAPARGVDALQEKVGGFNDRISETVKRLDAQGNKLGAQRVLLDGLNSSVSRSADLITGWSRIWGSAADYVSNKWDALGRIVDKALSGGTLDERLANTEVRLRNIQQNNSTAGIFANRRLEAQIQSELDELRQQRDTRDRRRSLVETAQNNRDVMELVRSLNPAQRELQDLQNATEKLRRSLSDPIRFGLDVLQFAQITAQLERLQNLTRNTREDMERFGSVEAANAVRVARSANDNIGLNSVDRAVAEKSQELERTLRNKGWDTLPTRDDAIRQYSERASDPNFDARDLASLQAEREARLRLIAERDALVSVNRIEVDGIRKSAEETAKRTSASSDFISAMINAESRGNTSAKNPNSSATGLGQFISETWLRLFPKVFPERAAGMTPEQMLSRRTDREDSIALIQALAAENRRALERADLPTNNRNQYLAWFLGSPTAVKALRADPDAPISSVASADAIASNRKVLEGRSVGQVLDWADRTINKNAPGVRNTERDAFILRSQVTATDQTTEAEARRAKVQELLSDAISRGTEIGRQFTTAQELMAAKSDKLTDTARNERQAMLDVADAYAKASASLENSRIGKDILFERAQLGRTASEQAVASRLRGTGLGLDSAEADGLRLNDNMKELKSTASSAFSGMLGDLRQGVTWMSTLTNMTGRFADKMLQTASDRTISAFFDAFTKGGAANSNGFLGTIASVIGGGKFDVGGYTGPGGRYEVAGFVHRGEVVYSQDDVRRHGGVEAVDAFRRSGGMRGFADGGIVGRSAFTMPSPAMIGPANDGPVSISVTNTGTPQQVQSAQMSTDSQGRRRIDMVTGDAFAAGAGTPQGREALAQSGRRWTR